MKIVWHDRSIESTVVVLLLIALNRYSLGKVLYRREMQNGRVSVIENRATQSSNARGYRFKERAFSEKRRDAFLSVWLTKEWTMRSDVDFKQNKI